MFHTRHRDRRRRRLGVVWFVLSVWIVSVSWGITALSSAQQPPVNPPFIQQQASNDIGTVDRVPPRFQLGQQLYLENCATCHVGVPPQLLPTQTWQQLLQDAQHYGMVIQPPVDPSRLLIWNYLQAFSRPLSVKEEQIPYRLDRSRYFKALHPRVEFSQPINLKGCVTCHPAAPEFNFRKLTPQWDDAP